MEHIRNDNGDIIRPIEIMGEPFYYMITWGNSVYTKFYQKITKKAFSKWWMNLFFPYDKWYSAKNYPVIDKEEFFYRFTMNSNILDIHVSVEQQRINVEDAYKKWKNAEDRKKQIINGKLI